MTTPPDSDRAIPRKKHPLRTMLAVLAIIFLFVLLINGVGSIHIFAKFETCAFVLLLAAPIGIFIFSKAKNWLDRIFAPRTKYDTPLIFTAIYALLILVAVLNINVSQDKTPREQASFPIVGKHFESFTSHISFYVEIAQPDFVDPPFTLSDYETIEVSRYEYERVIPLKSHITLTYQTGYLDIPWYEAYVLTDLAPAPQKQTSDTYPLDNPDIQMACEWASQFDISKEIETIEPDNYIRDVWPSGKTRAVEPTVKGNRHGVGHYTYEDGTVYGDIPWKHGSKHGVFKLYRSNGTLDQILSYKDGQPYGIQTWYKTDGATISRSLLYLQNGTKKNPAICAGLKGH